jgi:beta-alanine degradation protein BauB
MERKSAVPTVQVDDGTFRVTEWRFDPSAETGWHTHEHPYVVVPLSTGTLAVETEDGKRGVLEYVHGRSYSREPGARHNVVNHNETGFAFVEIELVREG